MANKVHLKIQIQDGDYYPQVTEKIKKNMLMLVN